jgi:hypothetical protein
MSYYYRVCYYHFIYLPVLSQCRLTKPKLPVRLPPPRLLSLPRSPGCAIIHSVGTPTERTTPSMSQNIGHTHRHLPMVRLLRAPVNCTGKIRPGVPTTSFTSGHSGMSPDSVPMAPSPIGTGISHLPRMFPRARPLSHILY